ncbi:MAG: sporulation protein [Flavonifractor plautii]
MEWLSLLLAAVLFAAACNLDTVILSMGYAVKGVRVSLSHSLIIAALTTLITWASLLLGAGAARVLSGPLPNLLGGLVLVGIGAWFVLDWLRRLGPAGGGGRGKPGRHPLGVRLPGRRPGGEQRGHRRGRRGVRYRPRLGGPGNFLVTLAALPLGRALGDKLAGRLLGKYALPLRRLLVLLGIWEAVG